MTLQECYDQLHGSYAEAKARLMTDKLIERFILKYPTDPSMDSLRTAIKSGSIEDSFSAVHTLKGVAGNLSFTELYNAASELTEQLRPLNNCASVELVEKVERCYKTVIDTIEAYKSEM